MFEIVKAGGILMVPILLCSLVALGVCIERFVSLSQAKLMPKGLVDSVLSSMKNKNLSEQQLKSLEDNSSLGAVLAAGVRVKDKGQDIMQAAMEHEGRVQMHAHERFLNLLGSIAAITPLLGLLGTVLGMIDVFAVIMDTGTGDSSSLAGGISTALITTAAGMSVAIPALFFHRYFVRKLEDVAIEMEQSSVRFMNFLVEKGRSPIASHVAKENDAVNKKAKATKKH